MAVLAVTALKNMVLHRWIPSMITQGYSATAALKIAQVTNIAGVGKLSLRKTVWLEKYRGYAGYAKAENAAKYIRKDRYPSAGQYVVGKPIKGQRYTYNVRIDVFDERTLADFSQNVMIHSPDPMTAGQAEQMALAQFSPKILGQYARENVGDEGVSYKAMLIVAHKSEI